jgi:hypothetical protein
VPDQGSQPLRGPADAHDAARRVCSVHTGGRGGDGVTDDDRRFQAGCLHQAVDLMGDVLLRDRLTLALAATGQADRQARHRVAEPAYDRLPDPPAEGQPVHEHDRRASAASNGDATSTRPARTSARSPAWISHAKSGMTGHARRTTAMDVYAGELREGSTGLPWYGLPFAPEISAPPNPRIRIIGRSNLFCGDTAPHPAIRRPQLYLVVRLDIPARVHRRIEGAVGPLRTVCDLNLAEAEVHLIDRQWLGSQRT